MRAFTLIEVVVGMTLTLLVSAVAAGVLVTVFHTQREGQLRNALVRQAADLVDAVGRDAELAGVGVPRGQLVGGTESWRPVIRAANATGITIVGDAPYPSSLVSGVVQIAGTNPARDAILVASELTGCVPGDSCTPGARAISGSSYGAGGCPADDFTCAWRDKWRPPAGGGDVAIVITGPTGDWVVRTVTFSSATVPATQVAVGALTAVGINGGALPDFQTGPGPMTAATLDRIYYSIEADTGGPCPDAGPPALAPETPRCTLFRRQCWGYVRPIGDAAAGEAPYMSGDDPPACDAPDEGTRWEVISNGVNQMRLRYFKIDNSELVASPLSPQDLAELGSIEVEATVIRRLPDMTYAQTQTMMRRVALFGGGGNIVAGAAAGGCAGADKNTAACLRESYQGGP